MKNLFIAFMVGIFLVGCGKSQEEIALENKRKADEEIKLKKEMDYKLVTDAVKYQLKDADSAKFRNLIGNCGEVNSKNSYGAYAGYGRFVYNRQSKRVVFDNIVNYLFEAVVESYCDKEYLAKYPPIKAS